MQIDALKSGVPTICSEITIQLKEAVERGTLSEREATEIFNRCIQANEA